VQDAPARVLITSHNSVDQGIAVTTMTIGWDAAPGAVAYDVEWRWGARDWIKLPRTGELSADVRGVYAGQYLARVRAVSSMYVASMPTTSMLTDVAGKTTPPPAVTHLTASSELFAIGLKWGFPAGAEDTQRTEIWYSPSNSLETATKLTDLAYPQSDYKLQGLAAGVSFFFWARLVDRTGNIGPWFPVAPNAVQGISSTDPSPVLGLISGQITESELGQELIEKIDGLQDQIDALDGLKAYDPEQPYTSGKMVIVDERIYQARQDVAADPGGGNAPPNPTLWTDVGQSVESANGLAQQVNTNTTKITEVDGKVTATAENLQALRASSRDDDAEGDLAGALQQWNSTAAFAAEVKASASRDEAIVRKTETLEASIGQTSAAVQVVSEAQATADGKARTMWAVKMELNAQDQYVAAGIGLGIENGPAGLQSQFLVSADRFAVVNNINGVLSSPFVVQGGQVFINQAFINTAFIQQIILGMTLRSQAVNSQGLPLIELNMVNGTFTVRGQDANGQTIINNGGVYVYDVNGVERTAVGRLP